MREVLLNILLTRMLIFDAFYLKYMDGATFYFALLRFVVGTTYF